MDEFEQVFAADPESVEAAYKAYDDLVSGLFYTNIPASDMLDPNTHPMGPDYVPPGMTKREPAQVLSYEEYRKRTLGY